MSLPNSPGRGIVLNVQSSLPVRTSNARTSPLVLLCVETVAPSRIAEPMMIDVLDDRRRGVDADLTGLEIDLLALALARRRLSGRGRRLCRRSDHRAGFRVQLDQLIAGGHVMTRSSPLPSVQYDTPRPESCRGDTAARRPSRRLCVQITSPVLPSSATTDRLVPPVV